MTARKLEFGEHLILGLEGAVLTSEDRDLLREYRPVGILFLGRNFDLGLPYSQWFEKFTALVDEIRVLTGRESLLLSIDHEGAQWVRTPAPITRFPAASLYRERASEVGRATALELASLGLNLSWAPVCDVHSNLSNPIIGPRAFATDAVTAGKYANDYYQGLRSGGVEGCAKHFPGHGDTNIDSHLALPTVSISLQEAMDREIAAFRPILAGGVPFVMTAHVYFPKIDPNREATRSSLFINDILRKECGFNGVVVSDDLEMKAVSENFREAVALKEAFTAGCDLFIVSRYSIKDRSFVDHLAANFTEVAAEPSVSLARERIDLVVRNMTQPTPRLLQREVFQQHSELTFDICGV